MGRFWNWLFNVTFGPRGTCSVCERRAEPEDRLCNECALYLNSW